MKRVLILCTSMFLTTVIYAQKIGFWDRFYVGISTGVHSHDVRIDYVEDQNMNAEITLFQPFGYNLSSGVSFEINKNFKTSFYPLISFQETEIEYNNSGTRKIESLMNGLTVELPVQFIVSPLNTKKVQPEIAFGGSMVFDISDDNYENELVTTSNKYTIDFGLGLNTAFKYFIMKPEIIYSRGLTNMRNSVESVQPNIRGVYRDRWMFRVLFYGKARSK